MNEGNNLYKNSKFDKAQNKYKSAQSTDDKSYKATFNLGNSFYRQENYEAAINEYNRSLGLTKNRKLKSESYYNIGNSMMKVGNFGYAAEFFKKALKENPNDNDTRYNYTLAKKLDKESKDNNEDNSNQDEDKDGNEDSSNKDKSDDKQDKDNKKQDENQQNEKDENGDPKKDNKNTNNSKGNNLQKIPKEYYDALLKEMKQREQKTLQKIIDKNSESNLGSNEKDW